MIMSTTEIMTVAVGGSTILSCCTRKPGFEAMHRSWWRDLTSTSGEIYCGVSSFCRI